LEKRASAPDFWDDPESAQAAMRRLSSLQEEVERWHKLAQPVRDALELSTLDDESLVDELGAETAALEREVGRLEFRLLLSGPHDRGDAILAIHAGAGGTDAQDWAEMLLRMYLRWAEARGYAADVVDRLPGEEAGTKRATVTISGSYAYGYLHAERGPAPATAWCGSPLSTPPIAAIPPSR
jgi:peptide chain release factor 2